jgi:hypothetical protein
LGWEPELDLGAMVTDAWEFSNRPVDTAATGS